MTEGNYKLHIKIGNAEFSAEGPEPSVKEAFDRFLQAISSPEAKILSENAGGHENSSGPGQLDHGLLEKVFSRDGEIVSLRLLPPAESANRSADAAILVLYGFNGLLNLQEVPVTKLNEGLRQSGISVDRLDRFIGVHNQLFRKGGTRSGGRYTLTNKGVLQAENWIKAWFN